MEGPAAQPHRAPAYLAPVLDIIVGSIGANAVKQVPLSLLYDLGTTKLLLFRYGAHSIDPGSYLPALRVARVDPWWLLDFEV